MSESVARLARAKLNLALHVTGQRPDGYHVLDSLVVFAEIGDVVRAEPASVRSLSLGGPFALDLGADESNLVARAAALMNAPASLHLHKNLPVASGLGGGSADAAATLLALAEVTGAPVPPAAQVLALGADVPACLRGKPARMRGIGERLEDLPALPPAWCVLVNPGVACPTARVFAGLAKKHNAGLPPLPTHFADADALVAYLAQTRNDLEAPAEALVPAIGRARAAIAATPGCLLARMTGSGATVFGLYAGSDEALAAAEMVRAAEARWWCVAAAIVRGAAG